MKIDIIRPHSFDNVKFHHVYAKLFGNDLNIHHPFAIPTYPCTHRAKESDTHAYTSAQVIQQFQIYLTTRINFFSHASKQDGEEDV